MNKRIEELAVKSGLAEDIGRGYKFPDGYVEFAELIVQGCITTVLEESKWYWDKDEWESSDAIQNAAWRIKERFGVK